jgi:hypothetical protein
MITLRVRLSCCAALLIAFGAAVPHPLQLSWDDARFIADNPLVQRISSENLRAIFGGVHLEAYHPLHLLSYWLDVPWAGANGPVLHAVSLMLWLGAAQLLLSALGALGLSPGAALVGTLCCTLHPVQVEAVSWASGRKDVLALGFVAASLLAHLRSERAWDRAAWLSRLAFGCAVLSKTTALPLPLWLLACDVALRGRTPRRALVQQLPSLLLAAALALLVVGVWRDHAMLRDATAAPTALRLLNTLHHQLATALWPAANAPMYSTAAVGVWRAGHLLLPGALLMALALVVVKRRARPALALLGFVIFIAPVANLVPMYFPFQDRYLSLPLLPVGFGVGALWDWASARRQALLQALFALAVVGLGARTLQYSAAWSSEVRLWGHAASTQRDSFYAWLKLGEVRRDAGDLPGAARAVRGAIGVEPGRKLGHSLLFELAALHDEKWRKLTPSRARAYAEAYYAALDDPEALRVLGATLLRGGYLHALELPMAHALALQPFPDDALEKAARTHLREGRPSVARFYLRQMRVKSRDPALLGLLQ